MTDITDAVSAAFAPGTPDPEEPLTIEQIVDRLDADERTLTGSIRINDDEIARLQKLNKENRVRLRQVKRMRTAAKPTRSRAKTSERPPKAAAK